MITEDRKKYYEKYFNKNKDRIQASKTNWIWRKRTEERLWGIKQHLEPINRALKNVKKPNLD